MSAGENTADVVVAQGIDTSVRVERLDQSPVAVTGILRGVFSPSVRAATLFEGV